MLRKGKYKYHYYVGYQPELFDFEADPEELHALAEDAAYKAAIAEMEKSLRERLDPEAVDDKALVVLLEATCFLLDPLM